MARPVLAIGIDAAQASLVKELVDDGSLPNLRAIVAEGGWVELRGTTDIGSGAAWPSFVTASPPAEHGAYCDWIWDPDRMGVRVWKQCEPFWTRSDPGIRLGTFDVPMAAPTGRASGFEVCGWAPRVFVDRPWGVTPDAAAAIVDAHEPHPFRVKRRFYSGQDAASAQRLGDVCMTGIRRRGALARSLIAELRPDVAFVVFGEAHQMGHMLWQTAEPDSPVFSDLESEAPVGVRDAMRAIDAEIGSLVETTGADAGVAVFALDGMGPARGLPAFLGPVLRDRGWASAPAARPGQLAQQAGGALSWTKRHAPTPLRRLYHTLLPPSAVWRVASKTALVPQDWSRTRAFVLPTNQHGYVRVNVRGREREGIVEPRDYDRVVDDLRAELAELETSDGRALVKQVLRTGTAGNGEPSRLPDLIVHWTEAAYDRPVRVAGTAVEAMPVMPELTGTHRFDGFCLARGLPVDHEPVHAEELARLLIEAAARE